METNMFSPETAQFSFFSKPVTNKRPTMVMTLNDAFKYITGVEACERTLRLRTITDAKERRAFKAREFDYAMFSGVFSYGNDNGLMKHSGLMCLDFDHVKDVREVKERLKHDKFFQTQLLFTSPSGDGVKWVVPIDIAKHDHRSWFIALKNYVMHEYGLEADPSGINVSRACFLPHDIEAYVAHPNLPGREGVQTCFDFDFYMNMENNAPVKKTTGSTAATNNVCNCSAGDKLSEVTAIANRIVENGKDITQGYQNWVRLGFALADGLGEAGRDIFHRLSQMNSEYKYAECEKQFTNCMRSHGSGITLNTFFMMAKEAGVSVTSATSANPPSVGNNNKTFNIGILNNLENDLTVGGMAEVAETPEEEEKQKTSSCGYTFSDKIDFKDMDFISRKIYELHHDNIAKCDAMLLGAYNIISGLLGGTNGTTSQRSGIYGVYDGRRVYAPLFNIVYSGAGNEKGNLVFDKMLAHAVKTEMRRAYEAEMEQYYHEKAEWDSKSKRERGEEPKEPDYRCPFVPGNSSSSAVYRAINANGGWGMMFETEADTISSMIDSDYGNYSDLMRKAHHHETISMNRVTDKLHIDIDEPRLSIFLTCTPGQLPALFPSFENGLGSRFLFYNIPDEKIVFHDVFELKETPLDDIYKELGEKLMPLYHALQNRKDHPIQFVMSSSQQKNFIQTYKELLQEQFSMLGKGIRAFVFRIALECFRYAMILTVLRRLSEWSDNINYSQPQEIFKEEESALVCDDRDYDTAMKIVECLINHTARVYAVMAKEDNNPFENKNIKLTDEQRLFYQALPKGNFHTSEMLEIAKKLNISNRTAERMLSKLCHVYRIINPVRRGVYNKPE